MSFIAKEPKDPDSTDIPYGIDWSPWLDGDPILTSTWDIPVGTFTSSGDSNTPTTTTIKLSGGTKGLSHTITNEITTANLKDQRSITIPVADK